MGGLKSVLQGCTQLYRWGLQPPYYAEMSQIVYITIENYGGLKTSTEKYKLNNIIQIVIHNRIAAYLIYVNTLSNLHVVPYLTL